MDTGYVNLISEAERQKVLRATQCTLGGGAYVAGAFVGDAPGAPFDETPISAKSTAYRLMAARRSSSSLMV